MINLSVLLFGGIFIYQGNLTTGQLIGFLLYVSMFMQPIRRITTLVENFQKGMAGFNRFIETLDLEPDIQDSSDSRTIGRLNGNIAFHNVTFSYNNKRNVLKDLDLKIHSGETVALVGPSGGGKTTLCSLIPRFYEVEQGHITIDGLDKIGRAHV